MAVILGVLASSGLVFAQLQTLGSASPFLALWTLGSYLVFFGILRWPLTRLTRWDAQFLHCLSRSYALTPVLPTPNIYTRFLAFAPREASLDNSSDREVERPAKEQRRN